MTENLTTVLAVAITAGCSLIGTIYSGRAANKLILYRIDRLEEKVDRHNNLVERMMGVESGLERLDARITDELRLIDQRIDARCQLTDAKLDALAQHQQASA